MPPPFAGVVESVGMAIWLYVVVKVWSWMRFDKRVIGLDHLSNHYSITNEVRVYLTFYKTFFFLEQ